MCPRRWAFNYKQNIREPSGRAADAGTAVHALLEHAHEKPIDPNETAEGYKTGKLATEMLKHAPELTRREFEFNVEIEGLPFMGRVDGANDELVLDWKTTSKVKYAKTARTLIGDTQRLLYVEALKPAKTTWIYGMWEDFSVRPVEVPVVEKRDRDKFRLQVLTVAETIAKIPEDVDPLSLPANTKSCSLFPPQGCMFKSKCFPATTTVGFNMSSILEKLRLEQEGAAFTDAKPLNEPTRPSLLTDILPEPALVPDTSFSTFVQPEERVYTKVAADSAFPIDTLYVDAIPLNQTYTSATKLLAEASQQVADDMHVQHVLLIDYNKGSAMLAAQFAANVKAAPEKAVVLETKSSEGKAVLHVAMSLSRNVVKGVF